MPAEIMDIFDNDAFRMVTLTQAVNKTPYAPNFLGTLGIFTPQPIRTIDAAVVVNDLGAIQVVPTTPRGAPPFEQKTPTQNVRSFRTPRVAIGDTIYAHELQGILARSVMAGGDMQIMLADLQSEIAFRLDGPVGLRSKQEATKERMRLGAISGIVLDADGSTLYDWPQLFGLSRPAEINLDLSNATPTPGALDQALRDLKRQVLRAIKAGNLAGIRLLGLCGDAFFDALVRHPDVTAAYTLYTQTAAAAAAQARFLGPLPTIEPFTVFPWGGVEWVNYRGTDDNETIAIDPDKCKFVPTGVPNLFQEVLAPAETFDYVNTPGLPIYVMVIPDTDRKMSVRLETYSYPMYVATRPDVLFSARRAA